MKLKPLIIKVTYNWYEDGLDEELKKKLVDRIPAAVKDIKKHFRQKRAYPLDVNYYSSDIMREVFGNHLSDFIMFEILLKLGKSYTLSFDEKTSRGMISKKKKGK